jgi:major membrane immunogen (membrane-anchored lipoprotein)
VKQLKSSPVSRLLIATFMVLVAAVSVLAQTTNTPAPAATFDGKYEGTARAADGSLLNVVFELKNEGGKVTGAVTSGATTIKISEGTLAEKKLTLKLEGHTGVLNAIVDGDKITGEWIEGQQKRAVELKKLAASATSNTAAAEPFSLAGDWEATADANGQPFPFFLVLKVEGEKVTGTSSSQLGESTVTNGTWKDGHLAFQLESANGVVTLSGTVLEGKLTGEFDYAGQLQGRWVAVKAVKKK